MEVNADSAVAVINFENYKLLTNEELKITKTVFKNYIQPIIEPTIEACIHVKYNNFKTK